MAITATPQSIVLNVWFVAVCAVAAQTFPATPSAVRVVTAMQTLSKGPQPDVPCPIGAIAIAPGTSIPAAIVANPAGTKFCLQSGDYR